MANFTQPKDFTQPVAPIQPVSPKAPIAPKSFTSNASGYTLQNLPTLESLESLGSLPNLNSLYNLSSLNDIYNRTNQSVSPFSNYNDPTEINSFADVIINTISKNDKLKQLDFGLLTDIANSDIPLISNAAGFLNSELTLIYNSTIKPLKERNFAALGINTLINLGESMDILASPVKGAIIETIRSGSPSGIAKGLQQGFTGRTNYDFDTGNWLLDMIGEVLVDPFNWISFGTSGAISQGVKSILTGTIDDIAMAAGGKIFKEGVQDLSKKEITKRILSVAKRELFDIKGKLIAQNSDDILSALFRGINRINTEYFDDAFLTAIRDYQIDKLAPMYITNLSILKGIQGVADVFETAEKVMFEGSIYSNFIPIEQLKNVKEWGILKNYTNKIANEVGQIVNGYVNTNELTKLANYNVVTNPKNIEYQKMKVNQILTSGGVQALSYLDIDQAISDKAIDAARNIRFMINEYATSHDFDTFISKVANEIVPEEMIRDSKDIYKTVIDTLAQDIKLIDEVVNEDGIKVFSNLSEIYEELQNNVKNIYDYDQVLKDYNNFIKNIADDDIILTKHEQEFIQQYKNNTFKYITAYENKSDIIEKFIEKSEKLIESGQVINKQTLDNIVGKFIKEISESNTRSKVAKDIQEFCATFIDELKHCNTIEDAYSITKRLFDTTLDRIEQLENVSKARTIFKNKQMLPMEVVQKKADIYLNKKNLISEIISEMHFDIKDTGKPLQNLSFMKEYYRILNEKTIKIDNAYLNEYKDLFKAIDNFQDTMNSTSKDVKQIKELVNDFRKELKTLKEQAEDTAEYCSYLIDRAPTVNRFKEINSKMKETTTALTEETYNKTLAELRVKCQGGFEAFNKAIENANQETQIYAKATGLVYGKNSEEVINKKTVFNTKNVPVKTIETSEGATNAFNNLFRITEFEDGTYNIPSARKLIVELEFTNTISESQDIVDFRNRLYNAVEELEQNFIESGEKFFESAENRKILETVLEDYSEYLFYLESEIVANFKRLTNRRVIDFDEIIDIVKHGNMVNESNPYLYELVNLAAETRDNLKQISFYDTSNKEFLAGATGVMYAAKDENLMSLYNALSEDVGITTEIGVFTDLESMPYKQLKVLLEDKATSQVMLQVAEKFSNDNKAFKALENFVKRMSTDPDIPQGITRSVMSSIESFKNLQLGDLDINLFEKQLYERINNFIYGTDSPKSLSVQNLLVEADVKLQTNIELHNRYMKEFTEAERNKFNFFLKHGETHISEDDAFVQEMLIRLFIPEEYISKTITAPDGNKIFLNKSGGKLFISDMEMSSEKGAINEIATKAMGDPNTAVFKVKMHDGWELPNYEIVHKMFPDLDRESAFKAYKALYNPTTAINKQAIESGKVIFFDSEKEMLEAYVKYLNDFNLADELIMHNGKNFDYRAFSNRCVENGIYLNTVKIKLSDSLVDLKDNLPLMKIDPATQIKVSNYIKQYLAELPDGDPTTYLFAAANRESLRNITDFLKELQNSNNNLIKTSELESALINLKDKYYNLLKTNDKVSFGINDYLISKDFFQTKQGQDILIAEIRKSKDAAEEMLKLNLTNAQRNEYSLYVKQLQDTLELYEAGILTSNNISKTMYIDRFAGDPALGFYKAVDLDTARNYMNIPDTDVLTKNQLMAITNFTRPLQNSYNAIRNSRILLENKEAISQSLNNLISFYSSFDNAPFYLKYIIVNPDDYKTNYVLLQKLYNKFTRDMEAQLKAGNLANVSKNIVGYKINAEDASSVIKTTQKYTTKEVSTIQTGIEIDLNSQYKKINDTLKEVIGNEQVDEILQNSSKLVFTKPTTEDTLFGVFKNSYESGELYETSTAYKEYINKFNDIMDKGLRSLSDSIDGTAFTSAFKFKTAQQVQTISNTIDSFTKWMDTLTSTEQTKIIQNLTKSTGYMRVNLAKQILELPDEDLLNFVLTNSMLLHIDTKFINDFDNSILDAFLKRKDSLNKIGLNVDVDKDLGLLTVYPTKNINFRTEIDKVTGKTLYEINGKEIEPIVLNNIPVEEFLDYLPEEIRLQFKNSQEVMNKLSNYVGGGVTYQPVDRGFYRKVYDNLPQNIKDNMLDLEYFLKDGLFNKRTRFNTTIIGSQRFENMYEDYIPNNFIKGYMNSAITLASRASDKANYIEMILNKDFSINNGIINDLSFEEMRQMLEDAPEFNLACMTYNKSGKLELIDLKLNTEVDFEFAKKNNAVILPYHVFANAYEIINSELYEEMSPALQFITKAMHTYKRGYLMSGGTIMRNCIDTFAKNLKIANGNVLEALSKTMGAMKLYMDYNKILNDIYMFGDQRINKETIAQFFKSGINTKMTYEQFSFVHEVLNSGALVGEVKALNNYRTFSKLNRQGVDMSDITSLDEVAIKALSEDFDVVKHLSNGLMSVNNDIENIQRLSAYMLLQDQGFNFTEGVYKVAKEHFNYGMKSPREKLIELIIPFYTFKINNLQYWAETLVNNPWIAAVFTDVMTPIWDFDDYDEKELKYNRSLQYRILSGNIQIGDGGLTFKLNPSASDAFKLMSNPLGDIYNSTFALYTFLTDAAMTQIAENTGSTLAQTANQVLNIYQSANPSTLDKIKSAINLLPYGAIAQRSISGVQYAQELNNILPAIMPSIFGRTKQYENNYTNYTNYRKYNMSSYTKGASGVRRYYPKKVYHKKVYPKKVYPKTRVYYNKPYSNVSKYPKTFGKYYFSDGFSTGGSLSTWTAMDAAKYNRVYNIPRTNNFSTTSIHDKLYTAKGKSRWDLMLQPTTGYNLKYLIKNTHRYYR